MRKNSNWSIVNSWSLKIHKPRSFRFQLLFIVIYFFSVSAVTAQDFKKQYRKAKELFTDGNYSAALDAFKPLGVYDKNNPYPEYASFYYALSAQRLGFTTLAKESFSQIKKIYPQWDKLDEVNYWLAKIYFEQHEYFHAFLLAKEINSTSFAEDLTAMKRVALISLDDAETLKMLFEENPEDEEAARALMRAIGKQLPLTDTILLDSISKKFRWNKEDFISNQTQKPVFKDRYRIALLLPFRTSTLDPGPGKKKGQFVLDLYQGMKQAADSLLGEGILIDLLAYDTDHDIEEVKRLLKEDEMKGADVIVGPLFSDDAKPVQEFSQANKINLVVNPLSFNSDLLGLNPMAFLFQPSHATLGERSAEMLTSKVSNKKCLVFYGESPKDSIMAFSFMRKAISLGLTIVYAEEVRAETSANILTTLATATEFDEWKNPKQFKLKLDSIGSVFVASDDPLIYTKVINSVETRGDSVVVVGQENWLEDNSVDMSKFERVKIALASPNFTSISDEPYIKFRRKYLHTHGILPGSYAQKGYEFIMVLGHALKKYGVYFQENLMNDRIPGVLTFGYQMQATHDNKVVPFISFRGGRLEAINKP